MKRRRKVRSRRIPASFCRRKEEILCINWLRFALQGEALSNRPMTNFFIYFLREREWGTFSFLG